jgi:hypothetical protein
MTASWPCAPEQSLAAGPSCAICSHLSQAQDILGLKLDFMGLSALLEKFYGIMNQVKENAIELGLDLQGSSLHSMCLLPGGFFVHLPIDPEMNIRWQGPGAKTGLLSP